MPKQCVSNGGNAVGEAIGQYMETVVQEYIGDFFESLSLSVHYQNRKESYLREGNQRNCFSLIPMEQSAKLTVLLQQRICNHWC